MVDGVVDGGVDVIVLVTVGMWLVWIAWILCARSSNRIVAFPNGTGVVQCCVLRWIWLSALVHRELHVQ